MSDVRWQKTLSFYRQRAPVVFFSEGRFWEAHGFVQRSLAFALAQAGIDVRWFDGIGWRPHRPVLGAGAPGTLRVQQLFALPGRRLLPVDKLSLWLQWRRLRDELRGMPGTGRRPFFWVQGGIDERLARALPPADVYSVFDDPYGHALEGALASKAQLVLCQNTFAAAQFREVYPEKTHFQIPPLELGEFRYDEGEWEPPPGFPRKIMGYVGSFLDEGFDFGLLERFVRELPEWGFVLLGRSDAAAEAKLAALGRHRNFLRLPWVPREKTAPVWRRLSVSLLLYPRHAPQDGAFATKAIESLHFGVPCVATQVPKTADLGETVARSDTPETLLRLAVAAAEMDRAVLAKEYARLKAEADPREHLGRVAEWLGA